MTEVERVDSVEVTCGAKAADCVCTLPPHAPDVPHHCEHDGHGGHCGGMWRGQFGTDECQVIRWPGGWCGMTINQLPDARYSILDYLSLALTRLHIRPRKRPQW